MLKMVAKMLDQIPCSYMRRCDFLNRAAGIKGWEDLRDYDSEARYTLEDEYEKQLNRRDLLEVTSLAMVNGENVDNHFSEEELRAQIFNWSSFPDQVVMYDPSAGKEVSFVVMNSLKYGQSNRAAQEKLERERPRDLNTGGVAAVVKVGPVEKTIPVNCGLRRRKLKTKRAKKKAALEQDRKRRRREMRKRENQGKTGDCSEAVVDDIAPFNGQGKSVKKATVDTMRMKLLGEKYNSKAHHGEGKVDRSIRKLLLSAHIGMRKKSPEPKTSKKLSRDEASAEEQMRKKWNSGWRKAAMFEMGVQRKTKPASQGKKGLAAAEKDTGDDVIAGLLDRLLDDAIERVERSKSLVMPEMTDDESEEENGEEDDMWNEDENRSIERAENKAVCDDVMNDVIDKVMTMVLDDMKLSSDVLLPEETDDALADDEDEDENVDEQVLEVNEHVPVLRLRGGVDVWLTEHLDGFNRNEVLECLTVLNISTDTSQNTDRLKCVLQQEQLSILISQQSSSTIVQVLKKHNLRYKDKNRREATLKMHFLRNPNLQQCILDDIAACGMMSPVSSEAESDGPRFHFRSPVTETQPTKPRFHFRCHATKNENSPTSLEKMFW